MTDFTSSTGLALRLFGPMQVFVGGEPLPALRSRKTLWALALLTLRCGRPVAREWLASTLWPDSDREMAFSNLRPVISDLRRALGTEASRLQSTDRSTVVLNLDDADVDVLAFDAAIKRGTPRDLERALALYRGALLEGCPEEWVPQERDAREFECLQAMQRLGELNVASRDFGNAIALFQRAIGIDPWRDSLRRGLMEALALNGDTNAALHAYREYADFVRTDPRATPDEETTAVYHRLRREARQAGRISATAPEAEAPKTFEGYVPTPLTEIVGRDDERIEVAGLLRRSRLTTLTGPGGIGKTRLSIQIAAEVARDFPDGVWFVALESLPNGAGIESQIASVLGVSSSFGKTTSEALTEHLRKKRALLVLDNCEHLLAPSAETASHLLRECRDVRILATSREAFGIVGETVWAVPPLAIPNPEELPKGIATMQRVLMGYEGVQLFLQRARALDKSFTLSGSNAFLIAQVCARLEGVPLAIELAAARTKSLSMDEIFVRLNDHLGLLIGGSRTASSRQKTIRSTLEWSFRLLEEPEQLILGRLAIFSGGWTLEAAESVVSGSGIGSSQVADLLERLIEKSLVVFDPADGESEARYRLLEMVRQYALSTLSESELAELHLRHQAYFATFVERTESLLQGDEQSLWLRRLRREYDNFRQAMNAGESNRDSDRLTADLWRYWYYLCEYSEGERQIQRTFDRSNDRPETLILAKLHHGLGVMQFRQGKYQAALANHERALALRKSLGDARGIADSVCNLANVTVQTGDLNQAAEWYEEGLKIYRELNELHGVAHCLINLGTGAIHRGDFPTAKRYYLECRDVYRQAGNPRGVAWALNHLGNVALDQGEFALGRSYYEESLTLFKEVDDRRGIGWTYYKLGEAALDGEGDVEEARSMIEEAQELFQEFGEAHGFVAAIAQLGIVTSVAGDQRAAIALFKEAEGLYRAAGEHIGTAESKMRIGFSSYLLGDPTGQAQLRESLIELRAVDCQASATVNIEALAITLTDDERAGDAVRLLGFAAALRKKTEAFTAVHWRIRLEQVRLRLIEALGEDRFDAEFRAGQSLDWPTVEGLLEAREPLSSVGPFVG